LVTPGEAPWATHAWHLYVLRVDRDMVDGGRDGLIEDLAACSIGSSVHFIPLHHHPVYREEAAVFAPQLGETERYFDQAVSLPLFPSMTDQDVADVITVVSESVRRRAR
jgi:dTDP-4-amino-4,6-dideoxygalactose transaminase